MSTRRHIAITAALAIGAAISLAALPGAAGADPGSIDGDIRPYNAFCRFVSGTTGSHFYTGDPSECSQLELRWGPSTEYGTEPSNVGVLPATANGDGLVALYRLYDTATGNHLYTTSVSERDTVAALPGWTDEGVTAQVYPNEPAAGGLPGGADVVALAVHRLYNTATGDHLYTSSEYEVSEVLTAKTWVDEGIAFWGARVHRIYPASS